MKYVDYYFFKSPDGKRQISRERYEFLLQKLFDLRIDYQMRFKLSFSVDSISGKPTRLNIVTIILKKGSITKIMASL